MKMKKGLLSVVFLLATSSAMAAMSYSSASVTSDMSVSLVDSEKALLALKASEVHDAASTSRKTSSTPHNLSIDLNKGFGDKYTGSFGVQPFSVYTWDDLFLVTNNSEHSVNVTIKTSQPTKQKDNTVKLLNELPHFAKGIGETWSNLSTTGLTLTIPAGGSQWIDIKTDTMNGEYITGGARGLDLVVSGEKVSSPKIGDK